MSVFLMTIAPVASQVQKNKWLRQAGQAWDDDKHYHHCHHKDNIMKVDITFRECSYVAGAWCALRHLTLSAMLQGKVRYAS